MTIDEYKKQFLKLFDEMQAEHGKVEKVLIGRETINLPGVFSVEIFVEINF